MKNLVLIISLILNLILAPILFFKSALNEIVKEWWKEKRKRKIESRNHLVELRKRLIRIQNWSHLMLINQASIKYITDPIAKAKLTTSHEEIKKEWGEANRYILDNEIHYPEDIKKLYKEYSEKLGKALAETITGVMYKERLLEIINSITPIMDSLITKVEDYLTKYGGL